MITRIAALLLLALGIATFGACDGDNAPAAPTAAASPTRAASVTASAKSPEGSGSAAPAAPSVAAAPRPSATPGAPRVPVTGLFNGAPPAGGQPTVVSRTLGPRPPSPFADWDGKQAVIYDTKSGKEIDLGEAYRVVFSPDSTRAAWIPGSSTGPATVMNLATGARRTYADGANVGFLDDRRLGVYQAQASTWKVFDLDTGQPSADQSIPPDQASQPGHPSYPPSPAGYYWRVTPDESTHLSRGGQGKSNFQLVEIASGASALQFDAVFAAPAGPGEVVVATPLDGDMTNVFVVNIQTGRAEFIARARYGAGPNWPLSATARSVLWTENFCWSEANPTQGHIRLYDRAAKALTDIDDGASQGDGRYATLTPDGSIGLGSFGASALIDPVSLKYTVVLPGGVPVSFRNWSPDYRYASYAPGGGHGGLC